MKIEIVVRNKEKLKDAIYGLAVGDAVGVPYEFEKRGTFTATGMIGNGSHHQPAGTWSDDTGLTLATCDSIKQCKCVNTFDILCRFRQWLSEGMYTCDGRIFDVGATTSIAIANGYGATGERSNGNGSLMRIIPLAFCNFDENLVGEVSAITHAHELSRRTCYEYVCVASKLLDGIDIKDVIKECSGRIPNIYELEENDINSSGYVIDTFEAAIWSVSTTENYRDAILRAVNLGRDSDTVGAVTGGLAGIMYGYEGIPKEWIETLRGKEIIESCLW